MSENKQTKEVEVNVKDADINKADLPKGKSSGNRKSRSNRGRGKKPGKKSDGVNQRTSGSNDVRWYANSPELLKSAASIPFSMTTGMKVPYEAQHMPGVYAMYWEPCLVNAEAVTASANSMYSYYVHANSRNTKYNAMDLMAVNIAGMSFFSFLALGIRTFGLMRSFNQENVYLPKALVRASGFDFDDLSVNYYKMWFQLNEVISKSTQLWIPNTMPLLNRWWWMNSNVYIDSETTKGQFYIFAPRRVLKYNETGATTGATLDAVEWLFQTPEVSFDPAAIKYHTWDEYFTLLNDLLNSLLNSEDRGIMFGDALRAFGEDRLYAVAPIDASYTVTPVYDREVLSQIENATCSAQTINRYTVTGPNTMSWTWGDREDDWHKWLPSNLVLNFHQKTNPTPEQIMVATRLMSAGYDASTGGPTATGTEHIVTMFMTMLNNTGGEVRTPVSTVEALFYHEASPVQLGWNKYVIWERPAYDWAPIIYSWGGINEPPVLTEITDNKILPVGDLDNFAVVSEINLRYMHNTAIYSLLGVPTI